MTVNSEAFVLVVDDMRSRRRAMCNQLNQLGLKNIDEATDGSFALEKLLEKQYKLIISDWSMKPMSGLELLQKVREEDTQNNRNIPFIMITTEDKPENILKAKQFGVTDYMVMPFNQEILKTKLVRILGVF